MTWAHFTRGLPKFQRRDGSRRVLRGECRMVAWTSFRGGVDNLFGIQEKRESDSSHASEPPCKTGQPYGPIQCAAKRMSTSESSSVRSQFENALRAIFSAAKRSHHEEISVQSGDLHRAVGGYPPKKNANHRMPVCCSVMLDFMEEKDEIIKSPPKRQGATLLIRYVLPRKKSS